MPNLYHDLDNSHSSHYDVNRITLTISIIITALNQTKTVDNEKIMHFSKLKSVKITNNIYRSLHLYSTA